MEFEIKVLKNGGAEKYYDDILKMLYESDCDFIPPLSSRSSTTQKNLTAYEKTEDGILKYFEEMKKQKFAVILKDNNIVAFVSYRENYTNDIISEAELPNIYLSTLILKPEARGKRLTESLYKTLFDAYKDCSVFTRTWSTNAPHIHILSKFGFDVLKTLENDRGEGIDTVYFVKRTEKIFF